MAKRPIFISDDEKFVKDILVEFTWFPGLSISQKQRSIESLHQSFISSDPCFSDSKVLEISSKSKTELGKKLSAFNLMLKSPKTKKEVSIECIFQGSKVFAEGGPYTELFDLDSKSARTFPKLKTSGELKEFIFNKIHFPLKPETLFYDWIYFYTLRQNEDLAKEILQYDAFTDIEFNPQKSISNQARAAAFFIYLHKSGKINDIPIDLKESAKYFKDNFSDYEINVTVKKPRKKKDEKVPTISEDNKLFSNY